MAVVLQEDGDITLNNTTKHCILHTVQVLLPQLGMLTVLPKSGSHKIDNFCSRLSEVVSTGRVKGKKRSIRELLITEDPLVSSLEVNQFYEGALSVNDFSLLIENRLVQESSDFDVEALHRVCWEVYQLEKQGDISFRRWFSDMCLYRLWLIFNTVLEPRPETLMPVRSVNEILKRLVELCGYTWNPQYEYSEREMLDYPEYLDAIAKYFDKFSLDTSLTCEVIQDMRDEIVDGVLKKGYLTKKGHKRRNWKRRWFVLQRTIMRYFESREREILKGQLVLNGNTDVRSIPDRGKRMYCFEVTCGRTGTPFEMCSDDHRSKHEWMLAIKKAIALAKVVEGSAKQDDFTESLAGFYLLKYGTQQPKLCRQDSTVRKMKYQATIARQRKRLSGKKQNTEAGELGDSRSRGSSLDDQDEYIEVQSGRTLSSDETSGEDEEGYLHMSPVSTLGSAPRYENIAQSLPASLGILGLENGIQERQKSPSVSTKAWTTDKCVDGFKLKGDDSDDSDEQYEDISIGEVRYHSKNLADSKELQDGYVHLVKKSENREQDNAEEDADTCESPGSNAPPTHSSPGDAPPTTADAPPTHISPLPTHTPPTDALPTHTPTAEALPTYTPTAGDPPSPADAPPTHTPPADAPPTEEESKLMSQKLRNSVSLDEDDLGTTKDTPKYLTILHSDSDNIMRSYTDGRVRSHKSGLEKKGAGPPVPPRKRSPAPPIGPRKFQHSKKNQSPKGDESPPTPPPRPAHTLAYRMSSTPVLPTSSGSKFAKPTRKMSPASLNSINESGEHPEITTPTDTTHDRLKS